jgi:hypothetical protein
MNQINNTVYTDLHIHYISFTQSIVSYLDLRYIITYESI